jgi:predicted NUDIX family phosphoesterase
MRSDEQVLVIPTRVLQEAGMFQGLCRDVDKYVKALLDPKHFTFLPRSHAEIDPTYKQLIPYVVLRYQDQLFHYRRGQGAGEQRLRAQRSIGVGGHINPDDDASSEHPYRAGMLREVTEEVDLSSAYQESCLGFINDDSTPVGQVHLGIVHIFELELPGVQRREVDLIESGFAPIRHLRHEREAFETWSQFVLDELSAFDGPRER